MRKRDAISPLLMAGMVLVLSIRSDAQAPAVDFESQIQPIFTNSCALSGCHTGETLVFGGLSGGGLILLDGQSYDQLVGVEGKYTSGTTRVIPGNSAESLLIRKLEGDDGVGSRMPASGGPLEPETIQLIKDWIDQGALREAPTAVARLPWGGVKKQVRNTR